MSSKKDETSETTVKSVKFLGEENFEAWRITVESVAEAKGLLYMMTNEKVSKGLIAAEEALTEMKKDGKTAVTTLEQKLYKVNASAKGLLTTSFSDHKIPEHANMHRQLAVCTTAYEMWTLILDTYQPKTTDGYQQLANDWKDLKPKAEHKNGKAYVAELTLLNEQIGKVKPQYKLDHFQVAMKIRDSVPQNKEAATKWDPFHSSWKGKQLDTIVDAVTFNKFVDDFNEEWKTAGNPSLIKDSGLKAYKLGVKNIICHNCDQKGHYANKCPKPTRDGKPPGTTPAGTRPNGSTPSGADKKQAEKDMSKVKCFRCHQMGHYAHSRPKKKKNANLAKVAFCITTMAQAGMATKAVNTKVEDRVTEMVERVEIPKKSRS
mgnify:CR=1 FL=1